MCTAAILVLPRVGCRDRPVSWSRPGIPLPLLLRDGGVSELGAPGPLLGAFEGSSWKPSLLRLAAGDQLVLFTDGVSRRAGATRRFGDGSLREQLVGAESPLAAIRRVTLALEAFIGGEPEDDVALVGCAATPPAAAAGTQSATRRRPSRRVPLPAPKSALGEWAAAGRVSGV